MGAAGNCLSSCQFHSSTYSDVITALHFLPLQNSLFLRISLTATLADALGLPWDCDCKPCLVGRGNLRESVGLGRLGYLRMSLRGAFPLSFRGMIVPKESRSGIPRLRWEQAQQSLCGPDKARLKSKMGCNEDIAEET